MWDAFVRAMSVKVDLGFAVMIAVFGGIIMFWIGALVPFAIHRIVKAMNSRIDFGEFFDKDQGYDS